MSIEGAGMEVGLELCFKGERDYLHGTDILNATLGALTQEDVKEIDFSFHRLARRQVRLLSGAPAAGEEPVAVCAYTSGGTRMRARILETDIPVNCRYPYPEDEIVHEMEVDPEGRRAVLRGKTSYSEIEMAVAMTKALHLRVFSHLQGKWLFVRGRFPHYTRHIESAERGLVIAASFNDKLTRSEYLIDGAKVGEIYFSIV